MVLQRRAQTIRSQLHNGDTVSFRLGLQTYTGTVRRKAEQNAAIKFHDAKRQKATTCHMIESRSFNSSRRNLWERLLVAFIG